MVSQCTAAIDRHLSRPADTVGKVARDAGRIDRVGVAGDEQVGALISRASTAAARARDCASPGIGLQGSAASATPARKRRPPAASPALPPRGVLDDLVGNSSHPFAAGEFGAGLELSARRSAGSARAPNRTSERTSMVGRRATAGRRWCRANDRRSGRRRCRAAWSGRARSRRIRGDACPPSGERPLPGRSIRTTLWPRSASI